MRWLIHRAMIWSRNYWGIYDILIENGKIVKIDRHITPFNECTHLDASDYLIMPGRISHSIDSYRSISAPENWEYYVRAGITTLLIPRLVTQPDYDAPQRWLARETSKHLNLPFDYYLLPIFPLSDLQPELIALWKKVKFTHIYLLATEDQVQQGLAQLRRYRLQYEMFFSIYPSINHQLVSNPRGIKRIPMREQFAYGVKYLSLPYAWFARLQTHQLVGLLPYLDKYQSALIDKLTRHQVPYFFYTSPEELLNYNQTRLLMKKVGNPKPFTTLNRIPHVESWLTASSYRIAQYYGWHGRKGTIRHGADADLLFFQRPALLTKGISSDNLLYEELYFPQFIMLRGQLITMPAPHWPRGQGNLLCSYSFGSH
ncbi:hypothetical protein [Rubeoparvulum massiliense]|uniref:hypothetical protein n=1 Tax=Rubeoparvulum massiliense TaxID=1631346 RepID=UPI00065E70A2|nr:hypothetical protein [Rubeoparvulum massiliense]